MPLTPVTGKPPSSTATSWRLVPKGTPAAGGDTPVWSLMTAVETLGVAFKTVKKNVMQNEPKWTPGSPE